LTADILRPHSRYRVQKSGFHHTKSIAGGGFSAKVPGTSSSSEHLNMYMDLLVYSSPWCPDCREAKRFLQQYNIAYTEIDIESIPGAAQEVIARTGKRAIPQFVIDGEWVQPYRPGQGFLYDEMKSRFGISE
jgi:glutaredoxin